MLRYLLDGLPPRPRQGPVKAAKAAVSETRQGLSGDGVGVDGHCGSCWPKNSKRICLSKLGT